VVDGVNIGQMLQVMNQRITVLLDRDHTIGHAYFMPLQAAPTLAGLADIFRQKILPLLQEYFFEDWERIRWVLNDQTKPDGVAFIIEDKSLDVSSLFAGVADKLRQSPQWVLNMQAFDTADAYRGIAANLGKGEA
jgi:5-methylcytosine-specific restriction protein B